MRGRPLVRLWGFESEVTEDCHEKMRFFQILLTEVVVIYIEIISVWQTTPQIDFAIFSHTYYRYKTWCGPVAQQDRAPDS